MQDRIRPFQGDILNHDDTRHIGHFDAAFLDPDWAQKSHSKNDHVTSLVEMQPNALRLYRRVSTQTQNIAFRLPMEINRRELNSLPKHELQEVWLDGDLKFLVAYFGDLKQQDGHSKLDIQSTT